MNQDWHHSLALITGASSGIGAAIAQKFAEQGNRVILVARHLEKLNAVADSIRSKGGTAYCYTADLSDSSSRIALVNNIKQDLGAPDILVNNAGIGWYGYFSQMPWDIANTLLELNIIAPTHLASLLLPDMLQQQKGRIINIGSIIGKLPEQGVALYSASKAYLDSFTTSLYREVRWKPVTVSVLRAGPVKTNFFENAAGYANGGRIPAESLGVPPELIAKKAWSLVQHPRRYAYVPFYTIFTPLLEVFFSWAIDLVGPILLRISQKS
jgi:short-subunit dehydrogenase